MKNFAVMAGNSVVNVIVSDNLESAELATKSTCIEYQDYVGIGWIWDGEIFIAPVVEAPAEETPTE
jgi:hypothetical protein